MDRRRMLRLLIVIPIVLLLAWAIGGIGGEDDSPPGPAPASWSDPTGAQRAASTARPGLHPA